MKWKLNSKIPQSWPDVLKVQKGLRFKNAKHYKDSFLLESAKKQPRCVVCGKAWKNCMDYYPRHSTAALTIMYGYVNKQNHASCTNARVYSFISVDLPRHAPHKFDAFLQPLFEELEELYIKGLEMFFKAPVPGSSPAQYTSLHVVPLLATQTWKLMQKLVSAAGGGKGCRQCELLGNMFRALPLLLW